MGKLKNTTKYVLSTLALPFVLTIPTMAVFAEETDDEEIIEDQTTTIPVVEKDFSYAKIAKKTNVYLPSKTSSAVGQIQASTTVYDVKKTANKAYYAIKITNKTFWIAKEDLKEASSRPITTKSILATTVQTKGSFKVYQKPSKNATVLFSGIVAQSFKTIDIVPNYYIIDVGGVKGYLPVETNKLTLKKGSHFRIVATSTPVRDVSANKTIGTLKKGAIITIQSISSTKIQFKNGKKTYEINRQDGVLTTNSTSLKKGTTAVYPVELKTDTAATVYTIAGSAIGTLKKNTKIQLLGISGNRGRVSFAGYTGYVDLKNFSHSNLVDPTVNITPKRYTYYLQVINKLYPEFTALEKIGASVEGRPIYALRVGNGKKEILMDAAIHAREHMTTNVLMEMIDQYTVSYQKNTKFSTYNTRAVLNKTAIWFVPMMNPDGVTLVQSGIQAMTTKNQKTIKAYNKSSNYKRWKSNGRGVDLNRNFDGVWRLQGNTAKSFQGYKGPSAFSEPESKALRSFVLAHKFKTNYSYHSSGQIIYWYNFQNKANYNRDLNLTRQVSRITGYKEVAPINNRASGSSADWFILSQKKPGLTVEIAPYAGNGPVPHKYWSSVWAKNKTIGLFGANEASKR